MRLRLPAAGKGKKGITAVVDEFVGRVAADTHINSFFTAAAAGALGPMKSDIVEK
jgi:truncated hemoglobin YjbI